MDYILNSLEMKEADELTIKSGCPSLTLMEKAGYEIYKRIIEYIKKEDEILIICSNGGNGGDGLVIARYLFENNYNVSVYLIKNQGREDFNINLNIYRGKIVKNIYDLKPKFIIDAIFGVGLSKNIEEPIYSVIKYINNSNSYVISIDIASGIDSNNGLIKNIAVKSDITYAVQEYKLGHFLNYGKDYNLKVEKVDIGITLPKKEYVKTYVFEEYKNFKEKRKSLSNKGTYGHVAIIGGSKNYLGAPLLSLLSETCLRSGVGYSTLCIPKSLKELYCLRNLETTYQYMEDQDGQMVFNKDNLDNLLDYSAIAIGMGIGVSEEIYKIIKYLLLNYKNNLIIDADGLNTLAKYGVDILKEKKCNVILTPHIVEFARLTNSTKEDVMSEPIKKSMDFARFFDCIVVLKSNNIIVFDKNETIMCVDGSPALAKAGSGDFLSGLILGEIIKSHNLLKRVAFSCSFFYELAKYAMKDYTEDSLLVSDLIKYMPLVLRRIKDE